MGALPLRVVICQAAGRQIVANKGCCRGKLGQSRLLDVGADCTIGGHRVSDWIRRSHRWQDTQNSGDSSVEE